MRTALTLVLAALVAWLAYDRLIVGSRDRLQLQAEARAMAVEAAAVPPESIDQVASTFPQEKIDALLASAASTSQQRVVEKAGGDPGPALVRNNLDPARMYRKAALAVTSDKVLGNQKLNPRGVLVAAETRTHLDSLIEIYQQHWRAASDSTGRERHRLMMERIARDAATPMDELMAELTPSDHATVAAMMSAQPTTSGQEREEQHRRLLVETLTKRFHPDAITTLPNGQTFAARRGELAKELAPHTNYSDFVLHHFYAQTLAFLALAVGLQPTEVHELMQHYEQNG